MSSRRAASAWSRSAPNPRELAERTAREWSLDELPLGYGLPIDDARRWGLHVSSAIGDHEPAQFTEPAQFVIRADGTLFASIVQTMPFSRPPAKQILSSLEFILDNDYPARGES